MRDLSLASVFFASRDMDWSVDDNGEGPAEVILPPITAAVLDERGIEVDGDDEDALAEAVEVFQESDDFYEWKDSYWPMMNFLWPIYLPYGSNPVEIAGRVEDAAGCVTLVCLDADDDSYGLALTGGGMDLSWNIAAAYVAAGSVPPVELLRNLGDPSTVSAEWTAKVRDAIPEASAFLRRVADRLDEDNAPKEAD